MKSRLTAIVVGLMLLVGVMLTAWGLAHLSKPVLPWWGGGLYRYVIFLIICTFLVISGSIWSKRDALFIGVAIAVGLALLTGGLWPVLVTLWFAAASTILGRSILSLLRLSAVEDNWTVNCLVGAGIYGTATGLLAHFPVNYPGVYGVALALPLLFGWRVVAERTKLLFDPSAQLKPAKFSISGINVAIAVIALVYFVVALMPEVGHDALAMHLFIPAHLLLRHQWGFDAGTYVWADMPMLGDWIFSVGYMLAGETAVRLINVGFIFILGWLVRDMVLWAGGNVLCAGWAALIFLSTPLTFTESSSLFIESIWASFVVSGTLAVLSSCSTSGKPKLELPVSGLLLGCALAAKAVTITILPVLLLLLVLRYRSWFRVLSISNLIIGLSFFLAIGLVPYVTAWWLTGNPVFPFFNGVFHSPYYPATNFDSASIFGKGVSWDILYRATFESGKYLEANAGASGFQWLLLLIPSVFVLLALRQRKGIALIIVGILTVVLVFQSVSYFRYAFPAWAILAAAIGVAFGVFTKENTFIKRCWFAVAVITVLLNLLFLNAGAQYGDFTIKSIGDANSREHYLLGRLPIRNAVELVNRLNVGRTPVAVFAHPMVAGLSADALYSNWYNHAFSGEITSAQTEQNVADILLKRGVNYIILDSNWSAGAEKKELIEKVTEKIAEYGSLSVRKIKIDYQFKTELLINPFFTTVNGWTFAGDMKYDAVTGVVLVSAISSATQMVGIFSGRRYLNTVVARCEKEPASGRIQINWLDAKGKYVSTDIKTFECSKNWTEHTMEVTAPPNAVNAVVYVVGQSSVPLAFKSNSLRQ